MTHLCAAPSPSAGACSIRSANGSRSIHTTSAFGLYQHDVNPRYLKESLEAVIESCVNHVGVDVNTATAPLLRHVSGLNPMIARVLIEYRKQHGPFRNREQLLQVPGMTPLRYEQAAGFLIVAEGDNPLDRTCIHPESYAAVRQILAELGHEVEVLRQPDKLDELRGKLNTLSPKEIAARLQLGVPTVCDILGDLAQPGRDPRNDHPPPILRRRMLRLEDLQPGMELKGTVLNVVDFGAFIDVGLKDSGLVHISQMSTQFIKNPYEIAAVGQAVTVWVMTVDQDRRRVSLTMIQPGTQRQPLERKPAAARRDGGERGERGGRPPRGRRPASRGVQTAAPAAQGGETPADQQAVSAPDTAFTGHPQGRQRRHGGRPDHRRQQRPPAQEVAQHPPPPHKPARPRPKPKLTQAALEGATPAAHFQRTGGIHRSQGEEGRNSHHDRGTGAHRATAADCLNDANGPGVRHSLQQVVAEFARIRGPCVRMLPRILANSATSHQRSCGFLTNHVVHPNGSATRFSTSSNLLAKVESAGLALLLCLLMLMLMLRSGRSGGVRRLGRG